jgi:putative transposase
LKRVLSIIECYVHYETGSVPMAQSLSQVYIHLTFSTYLREECLDAEARNTIIPYMSGIMNNLGAPALTIGGWYDHLHVLFRMPKDKTLMNLIQILKKDSSRFIKTTGNRYSKFKWQKGYCAISVSPSVLPRVIRYIQNQEQHHRHKSYREEVLRIVKAAGIDYDERFLFDE